MYMYMHDVMYMYITSCNVHVQVQLVPSTLCFWLSVHLFILGVTNVSQILKFEFEF